VSFFTFSSEPHRHFALWLLFLVTLPVGGLFALGVYLGPLFGDLTRTGFFSEREFGWNSPQVIFPHTQLEFNASVTDSGRYYDILVLGDSFSRGRPEFQWQNYLAAATGESVGTMDIDIRLTQILGSRGFRQHPPKILIMASAERKLPAHVQENTQACGKTQILSLPHINQRDQSLVFAQVPYWKDHLADMTSLLKRGTNWSDVNAGYEGRYLWHKLFRGNAHPTVDEMELARPALFTSLNQHTLLVYRDDLNKVKWWEDMGLPEMSCRIEAIRRQVEANGYTRFILMVAPDKLTAYADFLRDPKLKSASLLSGLSDIHSDIMPRFDKALIAAIHMGQQDVYFPDDTHWASNGQRIVAETLISFLGSVPL